MDYRFTSDQTVARADEIVSYLSGPRLWIPRLDYPDFDAWTDKVHGQLKREQKRALIALSGGNVVGAVVYQRHVDARTVLEIKNLTVRPDDQGRYVASFLLRNAEVEGSHDFGSDQAVVDAKARNVAIGSFLIRNGYRSHGVSDMYGLGAGEDVLYTKRIVRRGG